MVSTRFSPNHEPTQSTSRNTATHATDDAVRQLAARQVERNGHSSAQPDQNSQMEEVYV